jgi:uncharacterized protein (DUF58 family)
LHAPAAIGAVDPAVLAALSGLELRARYVMDGFLAGVHGSPFHGLSVEFRDYRDYQPGDDLRRLDWRLFARADRLCVKRYEQETNARVLFLCDTSASMAYRGTRAWASKLECARVVTLALAWLLMRQRDPVGLLALAGGPGLRYVAPAQTPHHVGVLLRELQVLPAAGGPVLGELLLQASHLARRRGLVIVVSDFLDPSEDVTDGIARLRFEGHECFCLQVLDPDEIDFPFSDGVLEDMESGERREVDSAAGVAYRERFQAFLEETRSRLLGLGATHALVRTDEDPGRTLARLLGTRGGA